MLKDNTQRASDVGVRLVKATFLILPSSFFLCNPWPGFTMPNGHVKIAPLWTENLISQPFNDRSPLFFLSNLNCRPSTSLGPGRLLLTRDL
jgi:hypothetical protein